ncbi:MAG: hypothetical protein J7530_21670 [Novosphingobium sp.]|nr:hypothetical protein [Novosphingobium sp.]
MQPFRDRLSDNPQVVDCQAVQDQFEPEGEARRSDALPTAAVQALHNLALVSNDVSFPAFRTRTNLGDGEPVMPFPATPDVNLPPSEKLNTAFELADSGSEIARYEEGGWNSDKLLQFTGVPA